MIKIDNNERDWIYYLSRPHTLFTATIWQLWYEAEETKIAVGAVCPDGLLVESPMGLVNYYLDKEQYANFRNAFKNFLENDPEYCRKALRKADWLNGEAKKYINGEKKFANIQEAISFMITLVNYATGFSYHLPELDEKKENTDIIEKCIELRKSSMYPPILLNIITPMAKEMLVSIGGNEVDLDLITYHELLKGDLSQIKDRKKARERGELFSYLVVDGIRDVKWAKPISDNNTSEIKGSVAFPGKIKGKARLIFSFDGKNVYFEKGDILVSQHTNPNLIPLIKKAAAIVTDEGGITSHAAIVARELKIPCIIGTKIATQVLKDGDVVEVDADKGVVRILKKNN